MATDTGSGHSPADKTIHRYHHAAAELWKFCFARGGAHALCTAALSRRPAGQVRPVTEVWRLRLKWSSRA